MNFLILSLCLVVQLPISVVLAAHAPTVDNGKSNDNVTTPEVSTQDEEMDERGQDELTTTTTTARPDEISVKAGESRGAIGIPADPHPGLKIAYRPPSKEIPGLNPFNTPISIGPTEYKTEPDTANHYFVGLGVQIDKDHVLMNHDTYVKSHDDLQDTEFNPINQGSTLNKQIDIATPGRTHTYTNNRFRLRPKSPWGLNGTDLRLYTMEARHRPAGDSPVESVKMETNPNEFGTDCHVHGYGQVAGSSFDPAVKGNYWGSTVRTHVKAPLKPVTPRDCDSKNSCDLELANPMHTFCRNTGAGSPVYCGSAQKLTYMAQVQDEGGGCASGWGLKAYHIPRLVGHMERS